MTPEAIFDPHDELTGVPMEIPIEAAQAFAVSEAEQIARRLLSDAADQVQGKWGSQHSHVRIHVVAGGTEIELDLDVGLTAAKRAARTRRNRPRGKAIRP